MIERVREALVWLASWIILVAALAVLVPFWFAFYAARDLLVPVWKATEPTRDLFRWRRR